MWPFIEKRGEERGKERGEEERKEEGTREERREERGEERGMGPPSPAPKTYKSEVAAPDRYMIRYG